MSAKFEVEACSASPECFTRELASRCQNNDLEVKFFYETTVKSIEMWHEETKNSEFEDQPWSYQDPEGRQSKPVAALALGLLASSHW
mmetsp:Transcript_43893/g.105908  ORF Transcript_43893/g.105908 Transcript_43893/m.105908 type:complete len:87 (-) Transcript_43893:71-331(-)